MCLVSKKRYTPTRLWVLNFTGRVCNKVHSGSKTIRGEIMSKGTPTLNMTVTVRPYQIHWNDVSQKIHEEQLLVSEYRTEHKNMFSQQQQAVSRALFAFGSLVVLGFTFSKERHRLAGAVSCVSTAYIYIRGSRCQMRGSVIQEAEHLPWSHENERI